MRTLTPAILILTLSVTAGAAQASGTPAPEKAGDKLPEPPAVLELRDELGHYLRRWRAYEEILGERRRQRLAVARFHLRREDFGPPLFDDPAAFDETTAVLRSCVSKLIRERIAERLFSAELRGRFERPGPAPDTFRLRISPALALGGKKAYVGARVRLTGDGDPIWSRFDLGFRERLERPGRSVFIQYRDHDRFLRLEHVFGGEAGDEVTLTVRWLL